MLTEANVCGGEREQGEKETHTYRPTWKSEDGAGGRINKSGEI